MNRFTRARICRVENWEARQLLTATGSVTHVIDSPGFGNVSLASGDDGRFDTTDLTLAFSAGEYEDGIARN